MFWRTQTFGDLVLTSCESLGREVDRYQSIKFALESAVSCSATAALRLYTVATGKNLVAARSNLSTPSSWTTMSRYLRGENLRQKGKGFGLGVSFGQKGKERDKSLDSLSKGVLLATRVDLCHDPMSSLMHLDLVLTSSHH